MEETKKTGSPHVSSWRETVKAVSDFYHVPVEKILGAGRQKDIAHARHMAMFLFREDCGEVSYPSIGRYFGRDHTTVLAAVEKIRGRLSRDESLTLALEEVRRSVRRSPAGNGQGDQAEQEIAGLLTPENVERFIRQKIEFIASLRSRLQQERRALQIALLTRQAFRGGERAQSRSFEQRPAERLVRCRSCSKEKKLRAAGLCSRCYGQERNRRSRRAV